MAHLMDGMNRYPGQCQSSVYIWKMHFRLSKTFLSEIWSTGSAQAYVAFQNRMLDNCFDRLMPNWDQVRCQDKRIILYSPDDLELDLYQCT